MYIEDMIRAGFRVYDLKEILGEHPFKSEIENLIDRLGPNKIVDLDENGYLYVKNDNQWKDTSEKRMGRGLMS